MSTGRTRSRKSAKSTFLCTHARVTLRGFIPKDQCEDSCSHRRKRSGKNLLELSPRSRLESHDKHLGYASTARRNGMISTNQTTPMICNGSSITISKAKIMIGKQLPKFVSRFSVSTGRPLSIGLWLRIRLQNSSSRNSISTLPRESCARS